MPRSFHRKLHLSACLLALLLVSCVSNKAPGIYKKNNTALVMIKLTGHNGQVYSQGSGIVLKDRAWVVTNFHVMEKPGNYICEHQGQQYKIDSVIAFDAYKDIMVLKYSEQNPAAVTRKIRNVRTKRKKDLRIGETVYAMGTPFGMENTISQGLLSGIRYAGDSSRTYIQISAPFSQGSSGGAIFDQKGRLIGMSTMQLSGQAQNINFGIPATEIIHTGENRIRRARENSVLSRDNKSCFQKGLDQLHVGNFALAREEFGHSLSDPSADRAEVFSMIGEVFRKTRHADSARYYFERSWNVRPTAQAMYLLGRLEFDLGNDKAALRAAEDALTLEKNHMGGQLLKCWLQFKSGDIAASRLPSAALLRRYPYSCEAMTTAAYYSLFSGKHEMSAVAQKMLSSGGQRCPLADLYMAIMYKKQGRQDLAERKYNSALKRDPSLEGSVFTRHYFQQ